MQIRERQDVQVKAKSKGTINITEQSDRAYILSTALHVDRVEIGGV